MGQQFGPVQQNIYERLKSSFDPVFLTVENESHTHNVPPGSESHFRVVIVTEAFVSQRLIKRHKAVNSESRAIPVVTEPKDANAFYFFHVSKKCPIHHSIS